MDLLLLVLVNGVLKCSATQFRILLGAIVGACFACISLFMISLPYYLWLIITYGITGILMVKISFRISSYIALLKASGILFLGIMMTGGLLSALSVQIPIIHAYGYSMLGVLGIGSFFCLFLLRIIRNISKKKKNHVYFVELINKEQSIRTTALWDTGNRLKEPISGKGVTVVEYEMVRELLKETLDRGFLYIPYHAIGTERGYLKGYCIDEMKIRKEYGDVHIKNPIIALYEGKIQKEGKYHMILAEEVVGHKN